MSSSALLDVRATDRTASTRPDEGAGNSSPRRHIVAAFALAIADERGQQFPATATLTQAAADRVGLRLPPGASMRIDGTHTLIVDLPSTGVISGRRLLQALTRRLVRTPFEVGERTIHLDVAAAWAVIRSSREAAEREVTRLALENLVNRDLMLRQARPRRQGIPSSAWISAAEVVATLLVFVALPFGLLVLAHQLGVDVSPLVYWTVVAALSITVFNQWAEALHAIRPPAPPEPSGDPAPPASAIIAAYLPNEAETIVETLESFLSQEYSGGLQVILAYNSPSRLPVEDELDRMAAEHPSLTLVRVEDSKSKAQNVNAALAAVRGEFVGIFDADHHPMAGAFERAWRWIASGVDVVQGHCVIRNGDASWVAGMVSIEFEQIYAVSHPGRAQLHGFGVFGGSNGFWRVQVLREIRLRRLYLTEDIDASIRTTREGRRIVNDPGLLSRELAPETLRALWKQRMRWAQGWFQVTAHHIHSVASDPRMTARQRRGLAVLLGWREAFLWLSALTTPLLAFFLWRDGTIHFGASILLLATLFAASSGPVQVGFAYRLGAPEIRRNRLRWFAYVLFSAFFYQELKNFIGRMAQVKHLFGERHWAVTPRTRRNASPVDHPRLDTAALASRYNDLGIAS